MTESAKPDQNAANRDGAAGERQAWHRPTLVKLGSLRDMTLQISPGNKNDGRARRNTSRGGDFEAQAGHD